MNLTDLQQELRGLEENLARLQNEIEQMKPKKEENRKIKFKEITKLAKTYPINGLTVMRADEYTKKRFISALSFLMRAGEEDLTGSLLYLNRLALGCELEWTAEDIYVEGWKKEIENIEVLAKELKDYRYQFLIEALILAGLSKKGVGNMLSIISDIAVFMSCDKKEIKILAMVAKGKVSNSFDELKEIDFFLGKDLVLVAREYIPSEWIKEQRVKCGEICTKRITWGRSRPYERKGEIKVAPCTIEYQKERYGFVHQGDKIMEYEEDGILKPIAAIKAGLVFYSESEKKGKEIPVMGLIMNERETILHIYIDSVFRVFEKEENEK